ILERASARETAVRVAAGTVLRQYLRALGVEIAGFVRACGGVSDEEEYAFDDIVAKRSPDLGMMNSGKEREAKAYIDGCAERGDTCGGILELRVKGLKSGFGSCMTYAEKLDARLAAALVSVQAVKGVEFGLGFGAAVRPGSDVHDEIYYNEQRGFYRETNRAGGIEGGMSNGEELVIRAAMKPIPTLMKGLNTVDYLTKQPVRAATERSDVCAITACEVVLESALAAELAKIVAERLGGDHMQEVIERYGRLV
ncbi:MAG: chorismate synthase, partial [Clostridia bacterium]|nr:chorismate synthase [Clostridia bacterium]